MDTTNYILSFIPGFMNGIVRVTISYPFDVVKTYSQKNGDKPLKNFRHICSRQPSVLYRGVGVTLFTVSIDRSIQYKYFEELKLKYNPYVAGGLMGLISGVLSVPMQSITSNLVLMDKGNYRGIFHYLKNTWRDKTISYFFKGYSVDFVRGSISTTIYLGTYGVMRDWCENNNLNLWSKTIVSSITAGWTVWIVTYPLDTMRVLYQTTDNKSLISLFAERVNSRGIFSLWRGICPVLFRTLPSTVCGMLVYENIRNIINN